MSAQMGHWRLSVQTPFQLREMRRMPSRTPCLLEVRSLARFEKERGRFSILKIPKLVLERFFCVSVSRSIGDALRFHGSLSVTVGVKI